MSFKKPIVNPIVARREIRATLAWFVLALGFYGIVEWMVAAISVDFWTAASCVAPVALSIHTLADKHVHSN